jgi:hypothetical protein
MLLNCVKNIVSAGQAEASDVPSRSNILSREVVASLFVLVFLKTSADRCNNGNRGSRARRWKMNEPDRENAIGRMDHAGLRVRGNEDGTKGIMKLNGWGTMTGGLWWVGALQP